MLLCVCVCTLVMTRDLCWQCLCTYVWMHFCLYGWMHAYVTRTRMCVHHTRMRAYTLTQTRTRAGHVHTAHTQDTKNMQRDLCRRAKGRNTSTCGCCSRLVAPSFCWFLFLCSSRMIFYLFLCIWLVWTSRRADRNFKSCCWRIIAPLFWTRTRPRNATMPFWAAIVFPRTYKCECANISVFKER